MTDKAKAYLITALAKYNLPENMRTGFEFDVSQGEYVFYPKEFGFYTSDVLYKVYVVLTELNAAHSLRLFG